MKLAKLLMALLVPIAALVVGCADTVGGSAVAGTDTRTTASSRPPASRPSRPPSSASTTRRTTASSGELSGFDGVWVGQYTCSQGLTGLRLTVSGGSGDDLTALFEFFAVPSNPQVPNGSFRMTGQVVDGQLTFRQLSWVDQPSGYAMVDLQVSGSVTSFTDVMTGRVLLSGCSTFSLRRQ